MRVQVCGLACRVVTPSYALMIDADCAARTMPPGAPVSISMQDATALNEIFSRHHETCLTRAGINHATDTIGQATCAENLHRFVTDQAPHSGNAAQAEPLVHLLLGSGLV